jgi:low affinity Fe/Cu permease
VSVRVKRVRAQVFAIREAGDVSDVKQRLLRLVRATPEVIGSPYAFLAAVAAVLVWLLTGPIFGFSSTWLVLPATMTSIGAFVIVFLIQYSQNRDTRVIQLKLDELIRGLDQTRTDLVRLETTSDEELERIEREFDALGRERRNPNG